MSCLYIPQGAEILKKQNISTSLTTALKQDPTYSKRNFSFKENANGNKASGQAIWLDKMYGNIYGTLINISILLVTMSPLSMIPTTRLINLPNNNIRHNWLGLTYFWQQTTEFGKKTNSYIVFHSIPFIQFTFQQKADPYLLTMNELKSLNFYST